MRLLETSDRDDLKGIAVSGHSTRSSVEWDNRVDWTSPAATAPPSWWVLALRAAAVSWGSSVAQVGHTCARWHLEPDHRSVKIARELTLAVLREWDLTRINSNVELVVSELVTNALRHGRDGDSADNEIELSVLSRDGQFVCAVRDTSDTLPTAREPDFLSESGRGLHLVACFSDRWGAVPSVPCGKFVWALFS